MRAAANGFADFEGDLSEVSVSEYYNLEKGDPDAPALVAYADFVGPAPDDYDTLESVPVGADELADDPVGVRYATYELGDRLPASKISLATFQSSYGALALARPGYGHIIAGGTNTAELSHNDIQTFRGGANAPDPDAPETFERRLAAEH